MHSNTALNKLTKKLEHEQLSLGSYEST
uniref:Uncharacterized protein n=1 Tax=Rhizophora mucronata TaxID=61149 RepID=A0A2P2PP24_RHIMU